MDLIEHKQRNLLVLDVDETLIHGCETPLNREADFRVQQFHIYLRPHLTEFLNSCSKWYELGVWSSASDGYVDQIVNEIFPNPDALKFVWGASKTTTKRTFPEDYERFGTSLGEYHNQKRLQKLKRFGWPLERILIVDDSPEKSATNYGNAIYPAPFFGQEDDIELTYLASYLETLRNCGNYRKVEKRHWRQTTEPIDFRC
jgi:RNA polymerase II subunit A small phosphatase-like protein